MTHNINAYGERITIWTKSRCRIGLAFYSFTTWLEISRVARWLPAWRFWHWHVYQFINQKIAGPMVFPEPKK